MRQRQASLEKSVCTPKGAKPERGTADSPIDATLGVKNEDLRWHL
jgi:hypothetical protein